MADTYFDRSRNPNKPGSEWQPRNQYRFEHPTEADLVLYILGG